MRERVEREIGVITEPEERGEQSWRRGGIKRAGKGLAKKKKSWRRGGIKRAGKGVIAHVSKECAKRGLVRSKRDLLTLGYLRVGSRERAKGWDHALTSLTVLG
jgi:hypothetical protein